MELARAIESASQFQCSSRDGSVEQDRVDEKRYRYIDRDVLHFLPPILFLVLADPPGYRIGRLLTPRAGSSPSFAVELLARPRPVDAVAWRA